jgi:hypothetical protein
MKKIACYQLSLSLSWLTRTLLFLVEKMSEKNDRCGHGEMEIAIPYSEFLYLLFRESWVWSKKKICALPTYRDFHANIIRKCRMDWLTEAVTKLLRSASVVVHSWIPNKHSQSLCMVRAGIWYQLSSIVWEKKSHLVCCNPSSNIDCLVLCRYWQTAAEKEGKNPMQSVLPYIAIVGLLTPFAILALAFANNWIKVPRWIDWHTANIQ